jgi:hypothetical protein
VSFAFRKIQLTVAIAPQKTMVPNPNAPNCSGVILNAVIISGFHLKAVILPVIAKKALVPVSPAITQKMIQRMLFIFHLLVSWSKSQQAEAIRYLIRGVLLAENFIATACRTGILHFVGGVGIRIFKVKPR